MSDLVIDVPKPKAKRVRKMRVDSKYNSKYAKELLSGIRYKKNLTIAHLCRKWRISRSTYYNWVERYEDFREAHQIAEMDYEAYLMDRMHGNLDGTERGSAAVINFALTNVAGWSNKIHVDTQKDEPIMAININILQPPVRQPVLEHIEGNTIEGSIEHTDNVVKISGE